MTVREALASVHNTIRLPSLYIQREEKQNGQGRQTGEAEFNVNLTHEIRRGIGVTRNPLYDMFFFLAAPRDSIVLSLARSRRGDFAAPRPR